jgi:hypothetical protein
MTEMSWNLKNDNEIVSPLVYSNGKSQIDIVNELISELKTSDIVILKGAVGTGKSAIALHLIKYFGKGIIVVPTKVLEKQYQRDYCYGGKYNIGIDIQYMLGKSNFHCKRQPKLTCGSKYTLCSMKLKEGESRLDVASACPYWSPVYHERLLQTVRKKLKNRTILPYEGIGGEHYYFMANEPCGYYAQFETYTRNCAILMNNAKWETETWVKRKPAVPIEIIDEGDLFLDSLTYSISITETIFDDLIREGLIDDYSINYVRSIFINLVKKIPVYDDYVNDEIVEFMKKFVNEFSNSSTSGKAYDITNKFILLIIHRNNSWAKISNKRLTVFIPRPDITLFEILKRSGKIVLMSATIQDSETLKSIFHIDPPVIVAEESFPGKLILKVTSRSETIKHSNWQNDDTRNNYDALLEKMLTIAKRPCLIQVHAKKYVPDKYKDCMNEDYFVNGFWWSTKTDRGIDLPDDQCRSIILLKYPYPDTEDIVFKVMRKLYGENKFWKYMRDIADRNLIQQCGRAVRNKNDWCEIYSPDLRCIARIPQIWKGNIEYDKLEAGEKICQ